MCVCEKEREREHASEYVRKCKIERVRMIGMEGGRKEESERERERKRKR